jgi:hypothetical protein
MNLTDLLAAHGGSVYFAAIHDDIGKDVEAAVRETYPDADVRTTDTGAFHFIEVHHVDGAISSYMFAEVPS